MSIAKTGKPAAQWPSLSLQFLRKQYFLPGVNSFTFVLRSHHSQPFKNLSHLVLSPFNLTDLIEKQIKTITFAISLDLANYRALTTSFFN